MVSLRRGGGSSAESSPGPFRGLSGRTIPDMAGRKPGLMIRFGAGRSGASCGAGGFLFSKFF